SRHHGRPYNRRNRQPADMGQLSITAAYPGINPRKKFPLIMNGLYRKGIKRKDAAAALAEMREIAGHLKECMSPDSIPHMELYHTSTGRNITALLLECIEAAIDEGEDIKTVMYDNPVDTAFL
ncbi:MAG TPA: hypothetical protein PLI62_19625, partial [Spirochaetota bacterium]|nr:hypothetical protein [Spirochaetota bacterium]